MENEFYDVVLNEVQYGRTCSIYGKTVEHAPFSAYSRACSIFCKTVEEVHLLPVTVCLFLYKEICGKLRKK